MEKLEIIKQDPSRICPFTSEPCTESRDCDDCPNPRTGRAPKFYACPNGTSYEVSQCEISHCPECGERTLVTEHTWDGEGDYESPSIECSECGYSPE